MSTFQKFVIGLDGEENQVLIPLIHTLVAGTTGVGKTEADRKIIQALRKAIPDLKVLIFDSKSTGRDWEGFGKDVKPFVKTSTDTRFLRDLIETSEERKIDFYLYELDQATHGAETWHDVLRNLEKRHAYFKDRKRELKEEKLGVLLIYMRGLIQGFEQMKTSDKFDLSAPITVVPINYAEEAFQQLVVYTYHKEIKKRRLKHILVVHDEMHKFAPSKRGTGCRRVVEEYYQEGRAAGNFGIASDQEIVGISPTVRSQCWNWILGMQTDKAKAKRVIEHLPTGNVSINAVMTLGVGWFFVVIRTPTETTVKKFYLLPDGISIEHGKNVIRGTLSVEEIMKKLSNLRVIKKEKEEIDMERLEKLEERMNRFREQVNKEIEILQRDVHDAHVGFRQIDEGMKKLHKKVDTLSELEKVRAKLSPGEAGEIEVSADQAKLIVAKETKTLQLKQSDLMGRIAIVYAEGLLPEGWFSSGKLNQIMEQRFGAKEFPGNFRKILPQLVYYGFFEKKLSGRRPDYRVKLPPAIAKKKGLLEVS